MNYKNTRISRAVEIVCMTPTFLLVLLIPALGLQVAASAQNDYDHDGLSNYQEIHKYRSDPWKFSTARNGVSDGGWAQRREFTYTIDAVLRVLKPADPQDMNDDYQDCRVLSHDANSYTVEVIYYPLNTNSDAIRPDPNWRWDDRNMQAYLVPTVTANWDNKMKQDLVKELRSDDIDVSHMTDYDLVAQVCPWALQRSRTTDAFTIWDVYYPHGHPAVYPPLRTAFDRAKPTPQTSDAQMFQNEVLGKQMFYNRIHGDCTSTTIYLATILRALGIPTRTVECIPTVDISNTQQIAMMIAAVRNPGVRSIIKTGLLRSKSGGFTNHTFNEVYIGKHWVRLNYGTLGQNSLDPVYFGLMTHIATSRDVSDLPIAKTWGMRLAYYPNVQDKLLSVNPYEAISVSDHYGIFSKPKDLRFTTWHLTTATIIALRWIGSKSLPAWVNQDAATVRATHTSFYIQIRESGDNLTAEMRYFLAHAGHSFVLRAKGHPSITAVTNTLNVSDSGYNFQAFGASISPADLRKMAYGVDYTIYPVNTSSMYRWQTSGVITVRKQKT